MMLLIFAVYMWKYIGKDAFIKAMAVFIIFSLPRIMGGAHWVTDVFVGSVSFCPACFKLDSADTAFRYIYRLAGEKAAA